MKQNLSLPTVADLFSDNIEVAFKNEQLNLLLNQEPKADWIKTHPYIKGHRYLPIDKVEFLLRKIFKKYAIEILREGTSFNGVYVVVRVHYLNPATASMEYHDGIGACQLQTKKDTSPSDLININNGAISMAFPIAKTLAVKDACDHFGKLFGCDLNRKDTIPFTPDAKLDKKALSPSENRLYKLIEDAHTKEQLIDIAMQVDIYTQNEIIIKFYDAKLETLKND